MTGIGKLLIVLGLVLVAVGVVVTLAGRIPLFGRLPGDIVIRRPGITFYFPLGTSVVISLVLSLLFWLFKR